MSQGRLNLGHHADISDPPFMSIWSLPLDKFSTVQVVARPNESASCIRLFVEPLKNYRPPTPCSPSSSVSSGTSVLLLRQTLMSLNLPAEQTIHRNSSIHFQVGRDETGPLLRISLSQDSPQHSPLHPTDCDDMDFSDGEIILH